MVAPKQKYSFTPPRIVVEHESTLLVVEPSGYVSVVVPATICGVGAEFSPSESEQTGAGVVVAVGAAVQSRQFHPPGPVGGYVVD